MTEYSRKVFFDGVRSSLFDDHLNQQQVDGVEAIFDAWQHYKHTDLRWLACILAQVRLEVGRNMFPVREGFKSSDREAIAHVAGLHSAGRIKRNYALPDPRTGLSYFGRGQIQITWPENYIFAGPRIGVDLFKFPGKALDPVYSARIAVRGCVEGWFRGDGKGRHSLKRYFKSNSTKWTDARAIVNGDNRGDELEQYAILFHAALIEAAKHPADVPEPKKGDVTMNGIFGRLFGGANGNNLIRVLFGSVLGAFGIENGVGGDIPGVDMTQMGLSQMMPMLMIYLLFEKLGIDREALTPGATNTKK